jgi:hypothetical protein
MVTAENDIIREQRMSWLKFRLRQLCFIKITIIKWKECVSGTNRENTPKEVLKFRP